MFTNDLPNKARNITSGLMAGTLVESPHGWLPAANQC